MYCVRSDLGNLLKALGRLDEAKVGCWFKFEVLALNFSTLLFQVIRLEVEFLKNVEGQKYAIPVYSGSVSRKFQSVQI